MISDECHLEFANMIDTLVLGLDRAYAQNGKVRLSIYTDRIIGDRMWAHVDVAVGR